MITMLQGRDAKDAVTLLDSALSWSRKTGQGAKVYSTG